MRLDKETNEGIWRGKGNVYKRTGIDNTKFIFKK